MTDTHTHIYMPEEYPEGCGSVVERALDAGVRRLVFPCVNLDSLEPMSRLAGEFPGVVSLALGLHPTEVEAGWEDILDRMESLLPGDFKAIGEVGIDLYHDVSRLDEQVSAFRRQLQWALQWKLPVIIHCREGLDVCLETLQEAGATELPLIFHSFTGSPEDVRKIREVCNPWFGFNGVLTFKNAGEVREALSEIGLEKTVLETDAPWLSPAPFRGRTNESSRIPVIADKVADVLGVPVDEVERITDSNAAKIFGLQ